MSKIFQAIKQLFGSKTRESFVKLVGTDRFENKFYERLPGKIYFFKNKFLIHRFRKVIDIIIHLVDFMNQQIIQMFNYILIQHGKVNINK